MRHVLAYTCTKLNLMFPAATTCFNQTVNLIGAHNFSFGKPWTCVLFHAHRYTPMTVYSVQVLEGKATECNFTLAPLVSEAAGSTTTHFMPSTDEPNIPTTTSASFSNSTQTRVFPSEVNSPPLPEHLPTQPQVFRHHNYADMELFLRKYSSEFPSVVHLYSVGRSVEQRELYVMVISDNPTVHEHGMSDTDT